MAFQYTTSMYSSGFSKDPMKCEGDQILVSCWERDLDGAKRALLSTFDPVGLGDRECDGDKEREVRKTNVGPFYNQGTLRPELTRLHSVGEVKCGRELEKKIKSHVDEDSNNALHVCAYRGAFGILKAIFSKLKGVAGQLLVDSKNKHLRTPLHFACQRNHLKVVKLLLQVGANPTLTDMNGYSCVHLAVDAHATEVVQYFTSKKLPFDMSTCSGMTPLILAATKDYRELAFMLAAAGGDICKKSTMHDGVAYLSPFVIATRNGWGEQLRQSGAVPEKPDPPYLAIQTDEAARFQWHTPAGRSAPVDYFRLQVRKIDRLEPDAPWETVADEVKERNHIFFTCKQHCSSYTRVAEKEDLLPSEVYIVRVFAHSIVGWSEPSEPSRILQTAAATPCTPYSPRIISVTNTSVTIEWEIPENNGGPVDYSEVQWRMCHTEWIPWSTVPDWVRIDRPENSDDEPSSSESETDEEEDPSKQIVLSRFTIRQLAPRNKYRFRVRCHNFVGWSYFSEPSEAIQTTTVDGGRRRGIDFFGENNVQEHLTGSEGNAVSRFMAMERARLDKRSLAHLQNAARSEQSVKAQREQATVKLQTFFRAWRAKVKFKTYKRDREVQQAFLIEYSLEEQFLHEWRALFQKHVDHAAVAQQKNQAYRDERRTRKIERRTRRERRQLIRKQRAMKIVSTQRSEGDGEKPL